MTERVVIGNATLYHGDSREIAPSIKADLTVVDPPYGDTSLDWDKKVAGWQDAVPSRCFWCFGSMRFFLGEQFPGWFYAQDIVWEKHNGSGIHADRFRRVHEHAVQFYRGPWETIYKQPQFTMDATARTVRRKTKPPHWGGIGESAYYSEDGGPRLQRSVIYARSMHGRAVSPTEKPVELLIPLIEYSCPPGGLVLDMFGGSFSTAVACNAVGRRCVAIEIDREQFDISCERIENAQRQERLFA